jgi:hypothetical protein
MTIIPAGIPAPSSITFADDADVLCCYPRPVGVEVLFSEEIWDFSTVEGLAPNVRRSAFIVDWGSIANASFRLAAKEVLFAKLHPEHPAVLEAIGWRRRLAIRGVGPHLVIWRALFAWLEDNDVLRLADVGTHHVEAYLERRRADGVSAQHLAVTLKRIRELYDYAPILTEATFASRPFARRTASEVAGVRRKAENVTPPIPEAVLAPLVVAALHLVEHAEVILAAREVNADLADYRCAPCSGCGGDRRARRQALDQRLEQLIEAHRREGRPLPEGGARGRSQGGVNYSLLGRWAELSPRVLAAPHRRVVVDAAAKELGVAPAPLSRSFEERPEHEAAFGQVIWAKVLARAVELLVTACYILIALSGMRGEEITSIRRGCIEEVLLRNGDRRLRLHGRVYKHQPLGGTPAAWVVTEEIAAAVAVLERLARPEEELLFSPATFLTYRRATPLSHATVSLNHYLERFCEWLADGPLPPGLATLPAGTRVNTRQFRRTMARLLAFRPHGVLAGKVQLKHLHVLTSEGYYGRANSSLSAFHAEIEAEQAAARLEEIKARYLAYLDGGGVAGGARRALLRHFEEIAGEMAAFPGTTLEADRHLEALLADHLGKLHIGTVNDCWFIDPDKAMCRRGDATASAPRPNACVGDRCANAVVTAVHLPVYRAAHEQVVSLRRSRKVSSFEKERLGLEQGRLEAVIEAVERRR